MNNSLFQLNYDDYTSADEVNKIFSTESLTGEDYRQVVAETNTYMPSSYTIKHIQQTYGKQLTQKLNTRERLRRKLEERKAKKAKK